MVYGVSPFQNLPIAQKLVAITNEKQPIAFPKLE
jgi:hypothetical protein